MNSPPYSFATHSPAFFIDARYSIIESQDAVSQQEPKVAANVGNEAAETVGVVLGGNSMDLKNITKILAKIFSLWSVV